MIYLYNIIILSVKKISKLLGIETKFFSFIPNSKKILEFNFKNNLPFHFVQVGANDGVSFDDLFEFVKVRQARGIVIEPIKKYFDELILNYENLPGIVAVNKAIHNVQKSITVFKVKDEAIIYYPDWVKGLASLSLDHLKNHNIKISHIQNEIVEADTFTSVIEEFYKYNTIDYLQIDTEGFDLEILRMIDFKVFNPKVIKYESVNLNDVDYLESVKLLNSKGYYVFKEMNDSIGVNLSKVKLK